MIITWFVALITWFVALESIWHILVSLWHILVSLWHTDVSLVHSSTDSCCVANVCVCVCMHVCVCVCMHVCVCVCMDAQKMFQRSCVHVTCSCVPVTCSRVPVTCSRVPVTCCHRHLQTYACMHVCVYVCECAYVCVCARISACLCMSVSAYVIVCMCVCMCIFRYCQLLGQLTYLTNQRADKSAVTNHYSAAFWEISHSCCFACIPQCRCKISQKSARCDMFYVGRSIIWFFRNCVYGGVTLPLLQCCWRWGATLQVRQFAKDSYTVIWYSNLSSELTFENFESLHRGEGQRGYTISRKPARYSMYHIRWR